MYGRFLIEQLHKLHAASQELFASVLAINKHNSPFYHCC